jgi:hypothetical protein
MFTPTTLPTTPKIPHSLPVALFFLMNASSGLAGPFLNISESVPLDFAQIEVVQGIAGTGHNPGSDEQWALEYQAGVDIGIGRGIQIGIGLPGVRTCRNPDGIESEAGDLAAWGLFNLMDAESAPWGLALGLTGSRAEQGGCGGAELILEKPFGPWTWVGNTGAGREWTGSDVDSEIDQLILRQGLTRQLGDHLSAALEYESAWNRQQPGGFETARQCTGPTVAFDGGGYWLTAGLLVDILRNDHSPGYLFQMQIGLVF